MGSAFSPRFCILYIVLFEEKFIYSDHNSKENIFLWKRYQDDVVCLLEMHYYRKLKKKTPNPEKI